MHQTCRYAHGHSSLVILPAVCLPWGVFLKFNLHCTLAVLAFCLGAAWSFGGNFIPLPVEELAARSQLVVRGTVLAKSCQRDEAGRIFTRVELAVAEVWKGGLATNRFTIVHGGGVLGEEQAGVSGQVEFSMGEEVVAFLVLNRRGEGVCLGLAQGKFEIWRDAASGEHYARNPIFGGPPPTAVSRSKLAASAVPSNWRLKVSDLKQRVGAVGK
ncbi:MAG: hypothetical protein HZA89_13555 [Verrucomicrobia bacterium]|nr:hypothetical protein [Verrucomicrobiota bacterium]